ncbi:hypothetical protein BC940DRAFT_257181 [Gongronella butleri]|nr:hypothetical protein BC940DRAFT_257181 [Gongronella butleri]
MKSLALLVWPGARRVASLGRRCKHTLGASPLAPHPPATTAPAAAVAEQRTRHVRDLLENVMDTAPSKRELQQFLKRYVPPPQQDSSNLRFVSTQGTAMPTPQEYVTELLTPAYTNQIALTKVAGPFQKQGWLKVGDTLHKLQKLGLSSIVVVDNPAWHEVGREQGARTMMRESMALVEAIEKAGGRAQLIFGGLLEQTTDQGKNELAINLDFVHAALNHQHIPIILPYVDNKPVKSNQVMAALTTKLATSPDPRLVPSKIVVINHRGGIPNHAHNGTTAHSLVNVQEEYDDIMRAYSPDWQYPIDDLTMVRDCLAQLSPTAASAVITPVSALPKSLITNLVTDKPLYSSSLPHQREWHRINTSRTTILRHGIKIHEYKRLDQLDLPRLTQLLEASFQRKLNQDAFYTRLERVLAGAIIAGDYQGAVLMTEEAPSVFYLDKFAIAPTSQGIGLTDILWKRMCDNFPELLWRSRKDNGVNKWYFERSSGYWRLQDTNWVLFWYGPNGYKHLHQYAGIAGNIPASFV